MKKIILLAYLSIIFSSSFENNYFQYQNYGIENSNYEDEINTGQLLKSMFSSAIIPGSGQYFFNDNKVKGLIFLGLEIVAWASYHHHFNKADNYKQQYQDFGNEHWAFSTWTGNYDKWSDENDEFYYVFTDEDCVNQGLSSEICYPNIWEDSHHVSFYYTDDQGLTRLVSSSSLDFKNLYEEYSLDTLINAQNFYNDYGVVIVRDHHFYENISKYNHFFSGWDDHDNISTENSNGYIVATSNNKRQYRFIYDQAVTSYRNRDNFMTFIFVNHFVSMLDALIVSKLSSNRTTMMIDYNERMNFFQAKLSIKLK